MRGIKSVKRLLKNRRFYSSRTPELRPGSGSDGGRSWTKMTSQLQAIRGGGQGGS
jgi:hypothetical protein